MAAEVTAVHDRGFGTIKNKNGHSMTVNVFELSVSFNQGKPEPVICFCHPHYKESVAKSLSRLTWINHPPEKEEHRAVRRAVRPVRTSAGLSTGD